MITLWTIFRHDVSPPSGHPTTFLPPSLDSANFLRGGSMDLFWNDQIETLSLKELTQKLVLLLALTSAARAHELAKLSLDSVSIKTDSWEFFLSSHVKTSHPGHPPRKIYLPAYHKNPSICVEGSVVYQSWTVSSFSTCNRCLILPCKSDMADPINKIRKLD